MRNWKVSIGEKTGGPYNSVVLRNFVSSKKLPIRAFVQPDDETADWQQVVTVDWLVDPPADGETRYCLECDCRATVSHELAQSPIRCPSCFNVGRFVNFLDETSPLISDVPAEPWGQYDLLACAFAVLLLITALIGVCVFAFNGALLTLIGFIELISGAALFAITFQHRSESSKYRRHLQNVEVTLSSRTEALTLTTEELSSLKRNLHQVRDKLVAETEAELDEKRREIKEQLEIARDQYNAVHRMAVRFLTETRKWWTSKLNGQNYQLTKERITKAIDFCQKQGYTVTSAQQKEILKQLNADYELVLKKESDKAEQARIREQMREEQRVKREMQKELERAEREASQRQSEHESIRHALEQAMKQVGAEHSVVVAKLQNDLKLAEERARLAQEAAQRTKSQAELTRVGNVYVISNVGSFGENGFKVGLTRRLDPMDRVKELGDASVPFPFDVHMMIRSEDAPSLERKLHQALHRYRINRVNFRKEFFRVDLDTIRTLVERHHGKVEYEYPGSNEESEYQQSAKISDADFEYLARQADIQPYEDDDDDLDGMDEHDSAQDRQ